MKHIPNVIQCSGLSNLQPDQKKRHRKEKKKKSEKVYLCFSPERLSVLVYLGMCAQAFKSYYREINWKYKNTVYTCAMSQIVKKNNKKTQILCNRFHMEHINNTCNNLWNVLYRSGFKGDSIKKKETCLLPCHPALEKYPDVFDSTQQPHQSAPTLLMCYQGFHWLFLLRFCLLLFWESNKKKNHTHTHVFHVHGQEQRRQFFFANGIQLNNSHLGT